MREIKRILVLALVVWVAMGVAFAGAQGNSEPLVVDGDDPPDAGCDEDDLGCTETGGSGGGTVEFACSCFAESDDPDGYVEMQDADLWAHCVGDCTNDNIDYSATTEPAGAGDWDAVVIRRVDDGDLEGICSWDIVSGIQGWHLSLATPNLIAKFNRMESTERGSLGGSIHFEINGLALVVDWVGRATGAELDTKVIDKLQANGFAVETSANYIRVVSDNRNGVPTGITDFSILYGSGTTLDDLFVALEPANDYDYLVCLAGGLAF